MQSEMKEWLAKSSKVFAENSLVTGTIIEVRPKEVMVDIGYKSEGLISMDEFPDPSVAQVGNEIEVLLERLEDDHGMVVLSRSKAELKKELGEDRGRLQRRRDDPRQGDQESQRRPDGGYRRRSVSSRITNRSHSA